VPRAASTEVGSRFICTTQSAHNSGEDFAHTAHSQHCPHLQVEANGGGRRIKKETEDYIACGVGCWGERSAYVLGKEEEVGQVTTGYWLLVTCQIWLRRRS
jgi:hypothetical protein